MAVTPAPTKEPPINGVQGLMQWRWVQWLVGLIASVNQTPGNSTPVKFAELPVGVTGMMQVVTDSTVNTWGTAIVIGGGAFTVTAHYNGTQWTVSAV